MISNLIEDGINGIPIIPGDKSISHRSIIIPSISNGICEIQNILKSDDVMHTLEAFKSMGVKIEEMPGKVLIHGKGLNSLKKPRDEIYLGNSGTSARLLTGLLSSQKFKSILTGDSSLSKRPMKRIADPLAKMNARISTTNGSLPWPLYRPHNETTSAEGFPPGRLCVHRSIGMDNDACTHMQNAHQHCPADSSTAAIFANVSLLRLYSWRGQI